jgi:hypothetical protein
MLSFLRSSFVSNKELLINAIGFQVVWFICVQGNNVFAVIATTALLTIHQQVFKLGLKRWKLLILFSLIGYAGDNFIAMIYEVNYSGTLISLWLLCLWLSFATTLNHSMSWLFNKKYISLFVGIFIVPFSYLTGISLSGSSVTHTSDSLPYWLFFLAEGIWWSILLLGYQSANSSDEIEHA